MVYGVAYAVVVWLGYSVAYGDVAYGVVVWLGYGVAYGVAVWLDIFCAG